MKYFEKVSETSIKKDFLAGVEPTGVFTFRNAMENKKQHSKHKTVGNIGGFIGGSAISAALGGAGTIALGKALQNKYPEIGKLVTMAGKDQFLFFRPKKSLEVLKKLPAAIGQITKEQKFVKDLKSIYKTKIVPNTKEIKIHQKTLDTSEKFTKVHGEDAATIARKGAAIIGIGGTAVLGGALNALSAQSQYNTALKLKSK